MTKILKRYILKVFAFLLLVIYFTGCKNLIYNKIDEGEIIYKVSYPGSEDNMMVAIMPDKMYFKFKDGKTISEFPAGMGLFHMAIKTNPENHTVVQEVKIMTEKKSITYSLDLLNQLLSQEPEIKIEKTKETKEIAGYKCKKAIATFPGNERKSFEIYYTNQINIPNPNWYNQFKELDGVPLQYNIKRWGFETHFEAIRVEKKEIDSNIFNPDKDYRPVSQREIDQIFENFN